MSVSGVIRRSIAASVGWLGIDLMRRRSLYHPVGRRIRLIESLKVDLVVDVGANEGQYATELRSFGYTGRIVSIEPLTAPFEALARRAASDPNWVTIQSAVGAVDEELDMNVAANRGASSSLMTMLPLHESNAPEARIVGQERVRVRRLDGLVPNEIANASRPFVKIDVQGFETRVLDGASGVLARIAGLQVELQLLTLYSGAPSFREMLDRLAAEDFALVGVEPVFVASDGRLLAADGLFVRSAWLTST